MKRQSETNKQMLFSTNNNIYCALNTSAERLENLVDFLILKIINKMLNRQGAINQIYLNSTFSIYSIIKRGNIILSIASAHFSSV